MTSTRARNRQLREAAHAEFGSITGVTGFAVRDDVLFIFVTDPELDRSLPDRFGDCDVRVLVTGGFTAAAANR